MSHVPAAYTRCRSRPRTWCANWPRGAHPPKAVATRGHQTQPQIGLQQQQYAPIARHCAPDKVGLHFPAFTAWKLHGRLVTFRYGEASSVLGSNKLNIRGLRGFASLLGEISGLIPVTLQYLIRGNLEPPLTMATFMGMYAFIPADQSPLVRAASTLATTAMVFFTRRSRSGGTDRFSAVSSFSSAVLPADPIGANFDGLAKSPSQTPIEFDREKG
jgi:hypothetical protein